MTRVEYVEGTAADDEAWEEQLSVAKNGEHYLAVEAERMLDDGRVLYEDAGEHLPLTVPNVHLLRRGLHYHLLLPASPVGEAL